MHHIRWTKSFVKVIQRSSVPRTCWFCFIFLTVRFLNFWVSAVFHRWNQRHGRSTQSIWGSAPVGDRKFLQITSLFADLSVWIRASLSDGQRKHFETCLRKWGVPSKRGHEPSLNTLSHCHADCTYAKQK